MICKNCGKRFESDFSRGYCDDCVDKKSKDLTSNSTRKRMIRNREFIKDYKKNKGCEICSYNKFSEILEFHHKNKNEKNKGINVLMKTLKNPNTIKKEINKCILLCPNCHRELHLLEKQNTDENEA